MVFKLQELACVSLSCPNEVPHTGCVNEKNYWLRVLGEGNQDQGVGWAGSTQAVRETLSQASPASGGCWQDSGFPSMQMRHPNLRRHLLTAFPVCVSVSKPPSSEGHSPAELGPPSPGHSLPNQLPLQWPCFQTQPHSEAPADRMSAGNAEAQPPPRMVLANDKTQSQGPSFLPPSFLTQ